jgi:hypothetical protein
MAEVEEVDVRNVQRAEATKLDAVTNRLDDALKEIEGSVESTRRMVPMMSEVSTALAPFVTSRLEITSKNHAALAKGVSAIRDQLKAGKYPSMDSCAAVNATLLDVVAMFKHNAQVHAAEGF